MSPCRRPPPPPDIQNAAPEIDTVIPNLTWPLNSHYVLFWMVIFACKFPFAYFLQMHIQTLRGRILETILSLRFIMFQYGIVYKLHLTGNNTSIATRNPTPELARGAAKAVYVLYDVVTHELLSPDLREQLDTWHILLRARNEGRLFSRIEWPKDLDIKEQVKRLHLLLTVKDNAANIPKNLEARRRLQFFSNSLFMDMPRAKSVCEMMPFCVLTPYYSETVLYSSSELRVENEDGISTLFYLQKIFPVHGMMYYRRALMLQSYLERRSLDEDVSSQTSFTSHGFEVSREACAQADIKFTYVVSCQIYGQQKQRKAPEATDIALLLQRNEALRVAFIHVEESAKPDGTVVKEFYSKLVKADAHGKDQEIFSIKLPGDPKLGEGKLENQNHAIIFTRGEAVQTIDMNQDNYLEEAMKMRNLLEEFRGNHGLRPPTILGVREHVFTGSVSSLAWFMSNQETSFVTLGQRVLAKPLKVFDRIFHVTRGGISKASRVINLSKDIFAGFNSTLRQGNITHLEYIQVGKGRDVGLNQIALFEGKVAGGNGEQVLSRDVYRLGQLFDFFRMLSFFFTTVGFYMCTMMTVLTVYVFLYGRAYLMHIQTLRGRILETILSLRFIMFQYGIVYKLHLTGNNTSIALNSCGTLQHGDAPPAAAPAAAPAVFRYAEGFVYEETEDLISIMSTIKSQTLTISRDLYTELCAMGAVDGGCIFISDSSFKRGDGAGVGVVCLRRLDRRYLFSVLFADGTIGNNNDAEGIGVQLCIVLDRLMGNHESIFINDNMGVVQNAAGVGVNIHQVPREFVRVADALAEIVRATPWAENIYEGNDITLLLGRRKWNDLSDALVEDVTSIFQTIGAED